MFFTDFQNLKLLPPIYQRPVPLDQTVLLVTTTVVIGPKVIPSNTSKTKTHQMVFHGLTANVQNNVLYPMNVSFGHGDRDGNQRKRDFAD